MSFYDSNREEIIEFMREQGEELAYFGMQFMIDNQSIKYNHNDANAIRTIVEIPYEDDKRIPLFSKFADKCIDFSNKRVSDAKIFEDGGLCYETARTSILGKIRKNEKGKKYIQQTAPCKEIVLRLGVALRLNECNMERFLNVFDKPFPRDSRDKLIIFFIRHKDYTTRLSWSNRYYSAGKIWRELREFLFDAKNDGWNFKSIELGYDNKGLNSESIF